MTDHEELLKHAKRIESWLRVGAEYAGTEADGRACREAAEIVRALSAALREAEAARIKADDEHREANLYWQRRCDEFGQARGAERAAHEATRLELAKEYAARGDDIKRIYAELEKARAELTALQASWLQVEQARITAMTELAEAKRLAAAEHYGCENVTAVLEEAGAKLAEVTDALGLREDIEAGRDLVEACEQLRHDAERASDVVGEYGYQLDTARAQIAGVVDEISRWHGPGAHDSACRACALLAKLAPKADIDAKPNETRSWQHCLKCGMVFATRGGFSECSARELVAPVHPPELLEACNGCIGEERRHAAWCPRSTYLAAARKQIATLTDALFRATGGQVDLDALGPKEEA